MLNVKHGLFSRYWLIKETECSARLLSSWIEHISVRCTEHRSKFGFYPRFIHTFGVNMDCHMIPISAFEECLEIKLLELNSGILVAGKKECSFNLCFEMQYPRKGCGSFNQMIREIAITLSPQDSSRLKP